VEPRKEEEEEEEKKPNHNFIGLPALHFPRGP
jgi:hypothetical protein